MREVVCPGRGDRNPHKSSLKKAPQSHEKEFGLHPIYAYGQAEMNGYHSPEIVA
jgi:hypothetical protein